MASDSASPSGWEVWVSVRVRTRRHGLLKFAEARSFPYGVSRFPFWAVRSPAALWCNPVKNKKFEILENLTGVRFSHSSDGCLSWVWLKTRVKYSARWYHKVSVKAIFLPLMVEIKSLKSLIKKTETPQIAMAAPRKSIKPDCSQLNWQSCMFIFDIYDNWKINFMNIHN